jgi:ketosteroid isomerase-like protein
MKRLVSICILLLMSQFVVRAQQADLKKLVETEQAFAAMAAEKGTKDAFLAYMTDDAVAFIPETTNAKAFWTARKPGVALLSWAPNYADISSTGLIGYTTGNWQWAETKDKAPSAFGDFITLWLRQPDGRYKWVLDIGVDHDKPDRYSTDWTTFTGGTGKDKTPGRDVMTEFYQAATGKNLAKAYKKFAAENIRSYREGKMPILGKKQALKELAGDKAVVTFAKRSTTFTADDISYNLNTYSKTRDGKEVEKGNVLQIWKFFDGRWQIVLDIFKPVK